MCCYHYRKQNRRKKGNILVSYRSVCGSTIWSWPMFCCCFSLLLMNIKTLQIVPLGCGRNKFKAQPQLQVNAQHKASADPWGAEQDGVITQQHHRVPLPSAVEGEARRKQGDPHKRYLGQLS